MLQNSLADLVLDQSLYDTRNKRASHGFVFICIFHRRVELNTPALCCGDSKTQKNNASKHLTFCYP